MHYCPYCDSDNIRVAADGGTFVDDNGDEWYYKCIECGGYFDYPVEKVNE